MGNDSKLCIKCGHHIAAEANFCPQCGSVQSKFSVCKKCSAQMPLDAKFCSKCGQTCDIESAPTTVPVPPKVEPQAQVKAEPAVQVQVKEKPSMPGAISLGLILVVLSFFFNLLVSDTIVSQISVGKGDTISLLLLGSMAVVLISSILLCKGYSIGLALLFASEFLGYTVLATNQMYKPSASDIFTCLYLIAFMLPSAWSYYTGSAQYRASRK